MNNTFKLSNNDIDTLLKIDQKRVLTPFDKLDQSILRNYGYPKQTLNPKFKDTVCEYCKKISNNKIGYNTVNSYEYFNSINCLYPNDTSKCTKENMYTMIVPTLHITLPWDKEKEIYSKQLLNLECNEKTAITKLLINMLDKCLDWGNNELERLYQDGILDKKYTAKLGQLNSNTNLYDIYMLNENANEGGYEIGTIFPFIQLPNDNLGLENEHIHIHVPMRITNNGYSHDNFLTNNNTNKFLYQYITGYNYYNNNYNKISYSLEYILMSLLNNNNKQYNKIIENYNNISTINYNKSDVIKDYNNKIINIDELSKLPSKYDEKSGLYLVTIPKNFILYRGLFGKDIYKKYKKNAPDNKFATRYTWLSDVSVAFVYATKYFTELIKKLKQTIPVSLKKKIEIYLLENGYGGIIGYKMNKEVKLIDILDKRNLKQLLTDFDKVIELNKTSKLKLYKDYTNTNTQQDIDYANLKLFFNKKLSDTDTLLFWQRFSFRITTGYNMTLQDQINNSTTSNGRKRSLYDKFGPDLDNIYSRNRLFRLNVNDQFNPVIGQLYEHINRYSTILNDTLMVDVLAILCGRTNDSDRSRDVPKKRNVKIDLFDYIVPAEILNKYSHIHGYHGRFNPTLSSPNGAFHSEICLFSTVDKDNTIILSEIVNNKYETILFTNNKDNIINFSDYKKKTFFKNITEYKWFYNYNLNNPYSIQPVDNYTNCEDYIDALNINFDNFKYNQNFANNNCYNYNFTEDEQNFIHDNKILLDDADAIIQQQVNKVIGPNIMIDHRVINELFNEESNDYIYDDSTTMYKKYLKYKNKYLALKSSF